MHPFSNVASARARSGVWSAGAQIGAAAFLLVVAACQDPLHPPASNPNLRVSSIDEGIPNGGMEGASASGTYTQWPVQGWQLLGPLEGYGDKSEPCTTTGFCNSGTITQRWGHSPDAFDDGRGLFAPLNSDPVLGNDAFAVLATQDIPDFSSDDRRYVMKGAVKIPITVPSTGRPVLMFDWAFATAELGSGPVYNDVARFVFRRQGQADVTLFEVSRNDLQPGGSGTAFTSIVRKGPGGEALSCGVASPRGFEAEYVLCTDWQRAQIDMTPYLGQAGTLIPSVEEVPYATDANGLAFEAEPRPSAIAFDNLRLSNVTLEFVEGVPGAITLSFPPLTAPYDQVIGYTFNVPGCVVVPGIANHAQVTCPDNGNYPFSINRISTGSDQCENYDFNQQLCTNDEYVDDQLRAFGLIRASNAAPTATFVAPATVAAGQSIQLAFTNPHDAAGDIAAGLKYSFDCGDGAFTAPAAAASFACPVAPPGTRTVRGRVTDKDGAGTTYTATVLSDDLITSIVIPTSPVAEEAEVTVTTNFAAVPGETYSATVAWGDGAKTNRASAVSGFKAKHNYGLPGLYTVTVTVRGSGGSTDTESATGYLVVYDPNGGFANGSGWIQSPAGAYSADPSATGRADFAFSAHYATGATVPTAAADFTFAAGNLHLTGTAYQWLVIPSPGKAKLKGTGQINGAGSYAFMLTVVDAQNSDASADRLRMKIWNTTTGAVVYDNERFADGSSRPDDVFAGSTLRGGDILVRKR